MAYKTSETSIRKLNAYTGQCFTLWKTPDTVKIYQITTEYVCESYHLRNNNTQFNYTYMGNDIV